MAIPLEPFVLTGPLGRGGMAEVWRGLHARQSVPVAVKVMSARAMRDPQARAAFRQEVQAVAGLDHPGIVLVFDHGETGHDAEEASKGLVPAGRPYLVMELADRGTLREVRTGVTWARVQAVLLDLLEALGHAHARGVVHRDLKPSNVLAFGGGDFPARFKLADFGLAYAVGRGAQGDAGPISGTPAYMAPEQILGQWRDDGPWTDLYALGCVAYELVCGHAVFPESTLTALADAHLYREPPPLGPLVPVPAGFEGWVRRLLRKDPRERFQRAADAAHGLRALGSVAAGAQAAVALDERPTQMELRPGDGARPAARAREGLDTAAAREALCPRALSPFPASWRRPAAPAASPALLGVGLGLYGLRPIPFVGRQSERDALWQALAEVVRTRRPRLVVLQGTAGSGKSRLAEWLAERAHEVGHANVMDASHGPMSGPGHGLSRMVARFLRCHGLSATELAARTEALLRGLGVDDPQEWGALARLVQLGQPGSEALGPALSAGERHDAARRLLRLITRKRPVIVRLDDVHWGADSLDFARRLLSEADADPLPVLLLATVREEALAERPLETALLQAVLRLPGTQRLGVRALPEADQRALVEQMLGLAGETVAQIVERTGGNPLFAVHLVADWVERGVLVPGDEGFALRAGEETPLPDDLHQVWSEHIARLLEGRPAESRAALEIAAALGREVFPPEWEEACRIAGVAGEGGLGIGIIEALVSARLARHTEVGWTFAHGMLRESVERLAREAGRWPGHQRACAAMVEARYPRGEGRAAERLAGHRLGAQEPEAAVAPLLQAARQRRETSEYRRARLLLDRREDTLRAIGAAAEDGRWAEGWVLRARIALHEGRLDEAGGWAERAAAAAQGGTTVLSEALRLLGDAARRQGELGRAAALYRRCVGLLDQLDNPHGPAASLWGLGDVHRQHGALSEALLAFARSRELYHAIGDGHGVADHLIGVADVAWQRADWEEAEARYREAQQAFEALGNRYGVARALNGRGEVARGRGARVEAHAHYARSRALLHLVDSADEVFPAVNLALLDLGEGRIDSARTTLLRMRDGLRQRQWRGLLACVQTALLPCHAAAGDWPAWDAALAEAAAILGPEGIVEPDVSWAAGLGAAAARRQGRDDRARAADSLGHSI